MQRASTPCGREQPEGAWLPRVSFTALLSNGSLVTTIGESLPRGVRSNVLRTAGAVLIAAGAGLVLALVLARPELPLALLLVAGVAVIARTASGLLARRVDSIPAGVTLYRLFTLGALALLGREIVAIAAEPWSALRALLLVAEASAFWIGWAMLQSLRQLELDQPETR
jgi:hypothetical protein